MKFEDNSIVKHSDGTFIKVLHYYGDVMVGSGRHTRPVDAFLDRQLPLTTYEVEEQKDLVLVNEFGYEVNP